VYQGGEVCATSSKEIQDDNFLNGVKVGQYPRTLWVKNRGIPGLFDRKRNFGNALKDLASYSLAWLAGTFDLEVGFGFNSWGLRVRHFGKYEKA
jgi:hypothetical protein